ncbi:DHA2 family efflux MFS transporter permease subunit [Deinococcus cavernae]|uniref:DHA2 family efflux MFS transporter permease subunit n=2 Tax=Deinococcus cavernae TaxID=2320857 RepID=A0A418VA86_9DEIO|nr:MDR family MFS transporter [Deinococcus cavernae]RJF72952.1 DHA2 family efflux MFS transporter permease subunit [Deinococcus cavernae]
MTAPSEPTPGAPAPYTFTEQEKRITLIGLMVVFLLAALSQNIVGTAMPRIVEELNGFNLYTWVTTAYLLASTVMVPIYGKLSDLYGRKPILVFGVVLFLVGSALCGIAGEPWLGQFLGGGMNQLIAARAVAGLGAAALITIAFTILGDMFNPAERAKFGGLFGAMFGLSSVIGPVIGGFLTDQFSWRWTFYANLPLGLLALFMIIAKMPSLSRRSGGKVDVLGALLILTTTIPLLLALTWGGTTYAWNSATILSLFAGSVVSLILFVLVERRTPDAIIPLSLFNIPIFTVGNVASFILNMAFFGVIMFLPLYMQMVLGVSPTKSGTSMLPLMLGLIVTSIVAGQIVARTGKYKPWMIGGGVILVIGIWSLTSLKPDSHLLDLYWRMFLVGMGLGPAQSLFTIAIQSGVSLGQLATATSSSQFFRQIGGTIGAAIFGTLLMNGLHTELPKHLPAMPGTAFDSKNIDMKAMRTAGSGGGVEAKIKTAMEGQYALIEQAMNGDVKAQAAIKANAQLPAELKTLVTGGLRAEVHQKLSAQAAAIQKALSAGEVGRNALLANPQTPDALKTQLQALPAQAFATPQGSAAVAERFAAGLLAQEDTVYGQAKTQALATIKTRFDEQGKTLAAQVTRGMKEGFTASITKMFGDAVWFALAGLIMMFFVPVITIRGSGKQPAPAVQESETPTPA